ncbi:MAG: translation initiation factor IF-3 [Candidatus Chisholmbacteria bacterium RIFCSPHIGHO2_01_FULL_48_12]|uniref:Translation initiation factor IF-3 n=1 Tax=Candidatus Chisholmbacteria bacterium RIFCSPHIGHO2_01_FULL_48_12 TaxID=1797589 RepID=A0A1G1VJF5_9BACT|nr:MAG: translation initiation factor IF-3 [Candidatus Chisholmbacteria bacterium RIFCSPHIGHO2_01_FULL_48_12]
MAKVFYRINQYIKADKLRVVDENAVQVGVLTKTEALARAKSTGLDLVEVAPNANPPVAKIIDFAKFKYQLKQKAASSKKGARSQDIKEIRFTPFIAANDFNIRLNKAADFLNQGNKVRLVVKFVGRQITHPEFGHNLLAKATQNLSELATVESPPNLRGKLLMTILTPTKK